MHILMIEDTEAVCEMMGDVFENEGWKASFITMVKKVLMRS